MFERFTAWGREVVVFAQEEARDLRHQSIGAEHILLGLLRDPAQLSAVVLGRLGLTLAEARAEVRDTIGEGERVTAGSIPFTPRAKGILEQSLREALSLGHDYIGGEHLLLALARERDGLAADILGKRGASPNRVRDEVLRALQAGEATPPPRDERTPPPAPGDPDAGASLAAPRFSGPWDAVAQAHLLLGLIAAGGPVADFLSEHGVTADAVRDRLA
jgi:ATP-dependent Clp protease ATP-binding subunit ClpC